MHYTGFLGSYLLLCFAQTTVQQCIEAGSHPIGSNGIPNTDPVSPAAPGASALSDPYNDQNAGQSTEIKHGELTYYDIGLGSCGIDHSGQDNSTNIAALSHLLMGTRSNDNPMCGKTVTIRANGRKCEAVVQDKCMGCAINDIDVSMKVFNELWDSLDAGRTDVEWWFND